MNLDHLSYTSLLAFSQCPKRFYWNKTLPPAEEEGIALTFGKALHASLLDSLEDVDKAMETFLGVWGNREGDRLRNPQKAKEIFQLYHVLKHCKPLPPPEGTPKVEGMSRWEIPFILDAGLSLPLVGYLDGLVETDGHKRLFELKTTTFNSSGIIDAVQDSPQVAIYMAALLEYIPDITEVHLEVVSLKGPDISCSVFPVDISDIKRTMEWVSRLDIMIQDCNRNDDWPMNLSACNSYITTGVCMKNCPYKPLCMSDDPQSLIPVLFGGQSHDSTQESSSGSEA